VKKIVQPGRPQVTVWRMRIASWLPKATNTHSEYVTVIVFPLQQRLHERTTLLLYTYIACLAMYSLRTLSLVVCCSVEGLIENHVIVYGTFTYTS
jgi:hypothetical protein